MTKKELTELSKSKVENTIRFIEALKHTKGEFHGKPFKLLDWQEKIITDVYGTLKKNGYRQYKNVWLELPKKNGKSSILAALGLKGLAADEEYEAEIYGCAADKNQASIIFDTAVGMLDQLLEDCPDLKNEFKVIDSKKRIVYYPTRSFYQVCSSESYSKHGINVHQVLFDEIHAQPNRDLYDVMTFGSGDARKQPLYWNITTAGNDPDRQSLAWELHTYAENILLGTINDPSWYPVIYGFDPDNKRIWDGWGHVKVEENEDWTSRRIWALVNPSLGHTVEKEKFEEAYITASQKPENEKLFKWLRLNMWLKQRSSKWISLEHWDKNETGFDMEILKDCECYGGLDLSTKIDISAFTLVFSPTVEKGNWYVLFKFWIPEEGLKERVKNDKVKYDEWVRDGYIKTTHGGMIDYTVIQNDILEFIKQYNIIQISYDPWNAYQLVQNLTNEGIEEKQLIEIRQNFKDMSEPMKFMGSLVMDGKLKHNNNPVARWMFGNVDILSDNHENIKPIKDKTGKNRIDGMVALINAMARAMFHEPKKESVYTSRGFLTL